MKLMALKRLHDIWQVFTGESFRHITVSVRSIYADRSRIGYQDCSRESVCLSMKNRKDKINRIAVSKGEINFSYFSHGR